MNSIVDYYNKYDEEVRLERDKGNMLEFETTRYSE